MAGGDLEIVSRNNLDDGGCEGVVAVVVGALQRPGHTGGASAVLDHPKVSQAGAIRDPRNTGKELDTVETGRDCEP